MIADLKPYPAMKDSSVEWLGAVPEHWEVRRLRNTSEMRVSNVDKHAKDDEQPVRLCNYVDVYKNERIRSGMAFMRATATTDEIERFRLQSGDVLITKDSEAWNDIGVPALVEDTQDDIVSGYHLALLRPFPERVDGGYLFRALQSTAVTYQFHVEANGVTRYGLSHSAIKSVWLPLAPLPEQSAIVRYLDHVDRRIRRYIRAKQKLVKLLEEQKQALIHQIVTRGLDPNVRLKPSGVEWLGEVPEHWEVVALKRVLRQLVDCEHKTAPAVGESDYRVVRTTAVRYGRLRWKGTYCTNANAFRDWTKRGIPEPGDVIFTREAPAGEACIVPEGKAVCLGQRTVLMKLQKGQYDSHFLVHMIYAGPPRERVRLASQGSTVGHFNMDDIGWMKVLKPPFSEQLKLVKAINDQTRVLELAVTRAESEISLLREYRTRLIADVVTGKLDVRGAAAGLREVDPLADEFDAPPQDTGELGDVTESLEELTMGNEATV